MLDRTRKLRVRTSSVGGGPVVSVRGEVDLRTAPDLRAQLLDAAGQVVGPLLIDLSGVTYMDSSGVGTLVLLKRELDKAHRKLVLISPAPRVRGIFEIAHLDRFFRIVNSIEEARSA